MNKTLRLLLFVSLALCFCASCKKEKEETKIPLIKASPEWACDSLTLSRVVWQNDSVYTIERLPYDTNSVVVFEVGDSLILSATARTGYTFINWICDGEEVSIKTTYGFVLKKTDIDTTNGSLNHHYEARFGLDYALQVIPEIHKIIPDSLIKAMNLFGKLYFGDNPPRLTDTAKFDHDTILGFYAPMMTIIYHKLADENQEYHLDSGTIRQYKNYFQFYDQHRGIAKANFKCNYIDTGESNYIFETAHINDSVFIMGQAPFFTAYFYQKRTKEHSLNYDPEDPGEYEAVIMSGEVTNTGVKNFYFAIQILEYNHPEYAGVRYPNLNDIIIFKHDFLPYVNWYPYLYNN